jgi:PKD repeat protein
MWSTRRHDNLLTMTTPIRRGVRSVLPLAVLILTALAAATATASADVYCVHANASQPCAAGSHDEGSDLQAAFNAAQASASAGTVRIGAGTYQAPTQGGFSYNGAPAIDVIGAGKGSTVLTGVSHDFARVLTIGTAAGSTVSDLSLRLPAFTYTRGLEMHGGTAHDIEVTNDPGAVEATGVSLLGGATLHDSAVHLTGAQSDFNIGVASDAGPNTISDVTVVSPTYGLLASGPTTTVRRGRFTAGSAAVLAQGGTLNVDDSLLVATGTSPSALAAYDGSAAGSNVNGTNLTLVNTGDQAGAAGVLANGQQPGYTAEIDLYNSIVHGFPTALKTANQGIVTTSADDLQGTSSTVDGGHIYGSTTNVALAPGFVDEAGGDYHLRHDSPLIDLSALVFSANPTDLDGRPRPVPWRTGGASTPQDIGAFEYQHSAPVAAAAASDADVAIGQSVTFDATASHDPDAGDQLTYQWAFDDGATAAGATVRHAFATAGAHTATLTVTDPTGLTATAVAGTAAHAPATVGPSGSAPSGAPTTPVAPAGGPAAPTTHRATAKLALVGAPKVHGSAIALTVRCSGATCLAIAARATTVERLHAGRTRTRTVTVGTVALARLSAGAQRTLTLRLNATGRRLLARSGRVSVTLAVSVAGSSTHRLTVKTVRLTVRTTRVARRAGH